MELYALCASLLAGTETSDDGLKCNKYVSGEINASLVYASLYLTGRVGEFVGFPSDGVNDLKFALLVRMPLNPPRGTSNGLLGALLKTCCRVKERAEPVIRHVLSLVRIHLPFDQVVSVDIFTGIAQLRAGCDLHVFTFVDQYRTGQ
jgi:hypothetical protein